MAHSSDKAAEGETPLVLKNVLSESRSPYVRGHMNNPVAWQMWGPEAIALAKKHNKLLFVSIGYAACHWCHVMERESFDNDQIADILNDSFIPIKVDREERPDVDRIYMNYVQATSGRGGWPLNVFLTPDLEPVFGGTYFPGPGSSMSRSGQMSFLSLLERIRTVWQTQREKCLASAKGVTEQLREFALDGNHEASEDDDGLDVELLEEAYQYYADKYDTVHAGFGGAPKFPTPPNLSFLLSLGQYPAVVKDVIGSEECELACSMVMTTLRNMTRGGIHDQIGYGFARYSVTRDWSLPHFEKMLYDQGQLLSVYLDAFLITGDAEMLGAVYDITTYLTTPPLAAASGGFYSSEDADSYTRKGDSEKHEGAFYVWTAKEFSTILGDKDAAICAKFYNVKAYGNVDPEHDAHDELVNQNVLAVVSTPEALAKEFDVPKEEVVRILKDGRTKLREYRERERPRPDLDDKIVVAWNGLAIGALARTSSTLSSVDPEKGAEARAAAVKAVEFIKRELFDPEKGTMKRVYREGPGDAPAFADDYAFFIQGLLELYEATFDDQYLEFADTLQKTQNTLFWDATHHGYFSTSANAPDMLLRLKDAMDAAEPSTNGVSAGNLYRLSAFLDDAAYAAQARQTCEAFAPEMLQHPAQFGSCLASVVAGRLGMRSVVVAGVGGGVEGAVGRLRARLKMNTVVVRVGGGAEAGWLVGRNELLKGLGEGPPRLMVCEGGTCREVAGLEGPDVEVALREALGG